MGEGTNPEVIDDMADPDKCGHAGSSSQKGWSERICLLVQRVKDNPARVRLAGVDVFESLPGCEQLMQQDGEGNTSVKEIRLYVRSSSSISHPFSGGNL
jgi:hypothetical protein